MVINFDFFAYNWFFVLVFVFFVAFCIAVRVLVIEKATKIILFLSKLLSIISVKALHCLFCRRMGVTQITGWG